MSQKNVEILIRPGEVFAAGDLDRWIAEFIDRAEEYFDRAEALEAPGLSE